MARGLPSPAQLAAGQRNWFTRQLRGAIGNLSHFASGLSEEDHADLAIALDALKRMDDRRRPVSNHESDSQF